MAGITQKSFETLFRLRSLKKTVVGYIDLEQKETHKKSGCDFYVLVSRLWSLVTLKRFTFNSHQV